MRKLNITVTALESGETATPMSHVQDAEKILMMEKFIDDRKRSGETRFSIKCNDGMIGKHLRQYAKGGR